MTRDEILEETIARLEAERYAPSPRPLEELLHPTKAVGERPRQATDLGTAIPPPTPEEQAHNLQTLLDAVNDPVVVPLRRRAS